MSINKKQHWENVFETKSPAEVSWTEEKPTTSLNFIAALKLEKNAAIIDIGSGDSKLVDFLLKDGFTNISVLDISAKAIERAKQRLGEKAKKVNWIVSDVLDFVPKQKYDVWHDRASFHFLTKADDIKKYEELTANYVSNSLIMGTFSTEGPLKCSGLEITQYNEEKIQEVFNKDFDLIDTKHIEHTTPFSTTQNFIFCMLKKK